LYFIECLNSGRVKLWGADLSTGSASLATEFRATMKAKNALARKAARIAAPKDKPAPRGDRGVARRGDTTRLSILNAAERCFGENGFDGVSLRTITEVAGVDLALVNYHFGSKDNLLHEVIARRARIVHEERVRALELARHEAGVRSPSVEAIVTAFLEPLLRRLVDGDAGWRHYSNLASQLGDRTHRAFVARPVSVGRC
jgi:AcrR family transcriptional regulator